MTLSSTYSPAFWRFDVVVVDATEVRCERAAGRSASARLLLRADLASAMQAFLSLAALSSHRSLATPYSALALPTATPACCLPPAFHPCSSSPLAPFPSPLP